MANPTSVVCADAIGDYRCKCADCRRSCCSNDWDVVISEEEFGRGSSGGVSQKTRMLARRCVEPNPHARGACDRYRCRMSPSGVCMALSEDGLCSWQLETGACSGRACDEFPLSALDCFGKRRVSATLACEAVVEPLVDRKEPIRMVDAAELPARDGSGIALWNRVLPSVVIDDRAAETRPLLVHYPLMVEKSLATLQDRDIALGDRVALVVRAMHAVDELEQAGETDRVPAAMKALADHSARMHGLADLGQRQNCDAALLTLLAKTYTERTSLESSHADFSLGVLRNLGMHIDMPQDSPIDNETWWSCVKSVRVEDPQCLPQVRARLEHELAGPRAEFFEHLAVLEFLRSLAPITQPGPALSASAFASWFAVMLLSVGSTIRGDSIAQAILKRQPTATTPDVSKSGSDEEPSERIVPSEDKRLVDAVVRTQRIAVHGRSQTGLTDWLAKTGLGATDVAVCMARAVASAI
jgi:hypothetical protein